MKLDSAKLVRAPQLLEILFPDEGYRPTVRWVRKMQKQRKIPYYKWGHSVFFDVEKVRESLAKKNLIRAA